MPPIYSPKLRSTQTQESLDAEDAFPINDPFAPIGGFDYLDPIKIPDPFLPNFDLDFTIG